VAEAICVAGNLGDVRVTKTDISDAELKIKTRLRTAEALTNIGNHYKEFGLKEKADAKYGEALEVAQEVLGAAQKLGGTILEQAYVQLWRTYFAMEQYNQAVGMSQRLMKEFPESTFVDEAMLQQAHAFRKKSDPGQAIQLYGSILRLNASPLKGEAQFGIAETYEEMAVAAGGDQGTQLYERAFVEYQKVYEQFPDSGRVGDAVAKMANFYYQKQDYHRAIDVFENVLSDYPDANFLDIILFNYGRCLYRLERRAPARAMFDQLINEFPESPVAPEAKRISEALVKAGF
jgi:TolA-binding protein